MKSKFVFCVILFFLALAVVFCLTLLEWVPTERRTAPSREAVNNPHLALERWMEAEGIAYRILETGNIAAVLAGPEKTIFAEASCFDWTGNQDALTRWITEGGRMVISKDSMNTKLDAYLRNLGITEYTNTANPPKGDQSPYALDEQRGFHITEQGENTEQTAVLWHGGVIRLVTLSMGEGSLTVTGRANFLASVSLREKPNANLAWDLLVKPGKNGGILFFQANTMDRNFFGSLLDRGNPTAFAIAATLLLIAGFWMVIPLFGRSKAAPELPGKPLGERFLAEGRFLKKYRALDKYLELYRQELELRRRMAGIPPEKIDPETPSGGPGKKAAGELKQFMEQQKKIIRELALRNF